MSAPTELVFTVRDGDSVQTITFDNESDHFFTELWSRSGAVMLSKKNKDVPFVKTFKLLRDIKCREFVVHDWTRDEAVYCFEAIAMQMEMLIEEFDRRASLLPPGDPKVDSFRTLQAEMRATLIRCEDFI